MIFSAQATFSSIAMSSHYSWNGIL